MGPKKGRGGPEIAVSWGGLKPDSDPAALLEAARKFTAESGLEVQLLDAGAIYGADHLVSAALHALRARERKTMRTSSLGMEILLYAAGKRQIRDAMALAGLSKGTRKVVAVLVGPGALKRAGGLMRALSATPLDEKEAAGGAGALERLGIRSKGATRRQIAELALEHVALLDLER